ncbi:hypothetical protein Zmor_004127 [Zophobas morio]|uniref:Uncharacterized protein n=1 Tax=Zophobas morio TaxID=2755281 RepID=A0AA38LZV9_9CUCU|nr:hypothetical protein Zmor_004127 [Zophobas morio]
MQLPHAPNSASLPPIFQSFLLDLVPLSLESPPEVFLCCHIFFPDFPIEVQPIIFRSDSSPDFGEGGAWGHDLESIFLFFADHHVFHTRGHRIGFRVLDNFLGE